ncbi:MAG TPA: hypothetical protein VIJ93_10510 [bacterium]
MKENKEEILERFFEKEHGQFESIAKSYFRISSKGTRWILTIPIA